MLNSYCKLSVPENLSDYYRVTDTIKKAKPCKQVFNSDVVVNRDTSGYISSVNYYSPEKELVKQVCYKKEEISKINYYQNGSLTSTVVYKNNLPALKFIFKKNGYLVHTFEYKYNRRKQCISICKKSEDKEVKIDYKYDDFDHIIKRTVSINKEYLLEQVYRYDILDRIIEYRDNNQRIVVNRINKYNELISYAITDKMNNDITIVNYFTDENVYDYTEVTVNKHSSTLKDRSYVDNVMLKKPYTSDDDLDLIIAGLFGENEQQPVDSGVQADTLSKRLINSNIEQRALPISMRKRLLYSLASKM